MNPEEFCPKLTSVLASCGVAIVFLPHIGGSFLHGATFYDKDKIVLGLTVRGKDADKFWFSLFHELGHILLGHLENKNGTYIIPKIDTQISTMLNFISVKIDLQKSINVTIGKDINNIGFITSASKYPIDKIPNVNKAPGHLHGLIPFCSNAW